MERKACEEDCESPPVAFDRRSVSRSTSRTRSFGIGSSDEDCDQENGHDPREERRLIGGSDDGVLEAADDPDALTIARITEEMLPSLFELVTEELGETRSRAVRQLLEDAHRLTPAYVNRALDGGQNVDEVLEDGSDRSGEERTA